MPSYVFLYLQRDYDHSLTSYKYYKSIIKIFLSFRCYTIQCPKAKYVCTYDDFGGAEIQDEADETPQIDDEHYYYLFDERLFDFNIPEEYQAFCEAVEQYSIVTYIVEVQQQL